MSGSQQCLSVGVARSRHNVIVSITGWHAAVLRGLLEFLGVDLFDDSPAHGFIECLSPPERDLLGHDHLAPCDEFALVADALYVRAVPLVTPQEHCLVVVLTAGAVWRPARRRLSRGGGRRATGRPDTSSDIAVPDAVHALRPFFAVGNGDVQFLSHHDWHLPRGGLDSTRLTSQAAQILT